MNTKWKKILEGEQEYQEIMLGSVRFREKLSKLLLDEVSSLKVVDDYSNPNWHLLQAEANGKRKAYELILKLVYKED